MSSLTFSPYRSCKGVRYWYGNNFEGKSLSRHFFFATCCCRLIACIEITLEVLSFFMHIRAIVYSEPLSWGRKRLCSTGIIDSTGTGSTVDSYAGTSKGFVVLCSYHCRKVNSALLSYFFLSSIEVDLSALEAQGKKKTLFNGR